MQLRLALPKGRLQAATAAFLERASLPLDNYSSSSRSYRLGSSRFPGLQAKVFQEKDIPVQVAVGNYDLGICGRDWAQELLARFPASGLMLVKDLGYGKARLELVSSPNSSFSSLQELREWKGVVRLASEYPNLAEAFALHLRLKRFQVFPLWGAAEAYPPENAEVALVSQGMEGAANGLVSLATLLPSSSFLIANRQAWENRDLAALLSLLEGVKLEDEPGDDSAGPTAGSSSTWGVEPGLLRLALPDGHQQPPTLDLLRRARIGIHGYTPNGTNRRPALELSEVIAKVIRPQDMPLQVAIGNFDLAITGQDWLLDHQCLFPTSPAVEILNLGYGGVRVVAVVPESLPVSNVRQLRGMVLGGGLPHLRVASEYTNIADRYAREHHLGHYQVIPTWGASEAFLPEDADLLIENTQTGRTLMEHNLKVIDTLMESRACLIGRKNGPREPQAQSRMDQLVECLRQTLRDRG